MNAERPLGALIRGNALVNIRAFVEDNFGSAGMEQVIAALDGETARGFQSARWSEWYPAVWQTNVLKQIDIVLGRNDLVLVAAVGRYQCMRDLASMLGWLFRVFPPRRLLEHMDVVWRRFHNTGTWQTGTTDTETWARLERWEGGSRYACAVLRGYLERFIAELSRMSLVLEHPSCTYRGDAACEYRVCNRLDRFSALPFPNQDVLDPSLLGREIAQLSSRPAVVDSIATILRTQCAGVDSSLTLGDDTDPVIVSGLLRPRYEHLWLLEIGGQVVGRLRAQVERAVPSDPRLRLLGELVPWFALALHRSSTPSVPHAGSWDSRTQTATQQWTLTPRQREVLGLLVRGQSNRQIALALDCAESTVEVHVKAIFKKAGVAGRTELCARVADLPIDAE